MNKENVNKTKEMVSLDTFAARQSKRQLIMIKKALFWDMFKYS